MAKTRSKKKTAKKSPFSVPKGKSQIHLLVTVDDEGETSFHEPSNTASEEDAIDSAIFDHPNSDAGRVIDVYHYVIEVKPPQRRKLPKAKKISKARKVRDGKTEMTKQELKETLGAKAATTVASAKKSTKKRTSKKASASGPSILDAPSNEDAEYADDED